MDNPYAQFAPAPIVAPQMQQSDVAVPQDNPYAKIVEQHNNTVGSVMPTSDVELSDRRNRWQKALSATQDMANAPFAGLTRAFGNTAMGAAQGVGNLADKLGMNNNISNTVKDVNSENDKERDQYYSGNPVAKGLDTAGNVAGQAAIFSGLGGGAKAGYLKSTAVGALQGSSQIANNEGERALNTGLGAGLGAFGKAIGDVAGKVFGSKTLTDAQQKAKDFVNDVFSADNTNPEDVAQGLEKAKDTNLPLVAADVVQKDVNGVSVQGRNTLGALNAAVNKPGGAADEAGKLAARTAQRGDRIRQMYDGLISSTTKSDLAQGWHNANENIVSPAYKEALKGRGIAPLEDQFEDHFNDLSKQSSDADKAINDASNQLTLAQAKSAQLGGAGSSDELQQAQAALKQAQDAKSDVSNRKDYATNILKQAQNDRANGTLEGAVWSPKLDQFLKQPEMQAGIKKGIQLERLDAVANGTPFKPKDYALTGIDENGDPVVGGVPNMRLIDAGKRGLDSMISSEIKEDGSPTQLGRSLMNFKNKMLQNVDAINPEYAKARQAAGDVLSQKQAFNQGRNMTKADPEDITNYLHGNPVTGKQGVDDPTKLSYYAGARRNMEDLADKMNDSANFGKSMWKQGMQKRVGAMINDPDKVAAMDNLMAHEQRMANTDSILGNSMTAPRIEYGKALDEAGQHPLAKQAARAVNWATNPKHAASNFASSMLEKHLGDKAKSMTGDVAHEVSKYLLSNDPDLIRSLGTQTNAAPWLSKAISPVISGVAADEEGNN